MYGLSLNFFNMLSVLKKLYTRPKQLFLVDGLGALLSAFFLGIVLVGFKNHIGMPVNTLYILAIVPVFFAIYSFSCYFLLHNNHRHFLKGIAIANLLYCCMTITLLIYYYQSLTILGLGYFLLEILIIGVIVGVELKASKA